MTNCWQVNTLIGYSFGEEVCAKPEWQLYSGPQGALICPVDGEAEWVSLDLIHANPLQRTLCRVKLLWTAVQVLHCTNLGSACPIYCDVNGNPSVIQGKPAQLCMAFFCIWISVVLLFFLLFFSIVFWAPPAETWILLFLGGAWESISISLVQK